MGWLVAAWFNGCSDSANDCQQLLSFSHGDESIVLICIYRVWRLGVFLLYRSLHIQAHRTAGIRCCAVYAGIDDLNY